LGDVQIGKIDFGHSGGDTKRYVGKRRQVSRYGGCTVRGGGGTTVLGVEKNTKVKVGWVVAEGWGAGGEKSLGGI